MDKDFKNIEDKAKKAGEKIKETAKDLAKNLDENTKEFQEEAKQTAKDFKKGAEDAYEQLIGEPSNKKLLAGIFAILLGAFGIHKFILGYTKEGIIMLAITIISAAFLGFFGWIMGVVGLIEGILYLMKTDEEFYQMYQVHKKPWF